MISVAILISVVAEYFSIYGLVYLFPGSPLSIIIMGISLALGKITSALWLKMNWNNISLLYKLYLIPAIIILMFITAIGCYGYLSKSHIESNIIVGSNSVELRTIETQEKIARERLDYLLKQASDPEKTSPRVDRDIRATQAELKKLSQEKLPLLTKENKLFSEIGPIKYVAELIYGNSEPKVIEKSVRILILIIILVFEPLAILLLIAAQQTYQNNKKKQKKLDKSAVNGVQYKDSEIVPKSKIAKMTGGNF
jgi:hypothetical protein